MCLRCLNGAITQQLTAWMPHGITCLPTRLHELTTNIVGLLVHTSYKMVELIGAKPNRWKAKHAVWASLSLETLTLSIKAKTCTLGEQQRTRGEMPKWQIQTRPSRNYYCWLYDVLYVILTNWNCYVCCGGQSVAQECTPAPSFPKHALYLAP